MQPVTVTLSDETLASLETLAEREHEGDREAAARELLAEWIERQ